MKLKVSSDKVGTEKLRQNKFGNIFLNYIPWFQATF